MTEFDKTTISNAAKNLESASASIRSFRETIETMKYADGGIVSEVDFASGSDMTIYCNCEGKEAVQPFLGLIVDDLATCRRVDEAMFEKWLNECKGREQGGN